MTVIIIKDSEKKSHLLKTIKDIFSSPEVSEWEYILSARCPRCNQIFVSSTNRIYCSKECQYNKQKIG